MESVVGVVQGVTGHTFDIIYDLYFTEERLIGVLIQHPSEVMDHQSSLGLQTIFLGNSFSKRQEQHDRNLLADERRSQNKKMTPSGLAASHPSNYVIRYESITTVEVKKSLLGTSLKITPTDPARKLRSFGLSKKQAQEIRPLLALVLPTKLKA
jgi:hypothetical protein